MKIVLVEDQVMLRELLVLYLGIQEDMEVVAALGDANRAMGAMTGAEVDLVLMDICTERGNSGLVAAQGIKEKFPSCRIVLMTGTHDVSHMGHAQQIGVDGFIYKDAGLGDLLATLRFAHEGYTVFPAKEGHPNASIMSFSRDEVRLLRLICEGCSRKQLAEELCVSQGTVKRRVGELLAKTGYENVFKLAVVAIAKGYIDPRVKRCVLKDGARDDDAE